jgi:hypothetical protein
MQRWLRSLRGKVDVVIDFGCGRGKMGQQVRKIFGPDIKIIGCDVYDPVIAVARSTGAYDTVQPGSIETMVQLLQVSIDTPESTARSILGITPKTRQLWFFGDVLEHMPRDVAMKILRSKVPQFIAVRIPVGPWPQHCDDNPAESHLWSFYPQDLKEVPGVKIIRRRILTSRPERAEGSYGDLSYRKSYETPSTFLGNFMLKVLKKVKS